MTRSHCYGMIHSSLFLFILFHIVNDYIYIFFYHIYLTSYTDVLILCFTTYDTVYYGLARRPLLLTKRN